MPISLPIVIQRLNKHQLLLCIDRAMYCFCLLCIQKSFCIRKKVDSLWHELIYLCSSISRIKYHNPELHFSPHIPRTISRHPFQVTFMRGKNLKVYRNIKIKFGIYPVHVRHIYFCLKSSETFSIS